MAKRKSVATIGFGFDPAQSPHHFVVETGRDHGDITIVERFVWGDASESDEAAPEPSPKASLDAYRWARVAPTAGETFNARLRAAGLKTADWSTAPPLAPHLGKELTLLAWAAEDADPTLLPAIIANWSGLAPEERWWFYTTINATAGHPEHGRDRGWRKAIKIAFAENPVSAAPSALLTSPTTPSGLARPAKRQGKRARTDAEAVQMELF